MPILKTHFCASPAPSVAKQFVLVLLPPQQFVEASATTSGRQSERAAATAGVKPAEQEAPQPPRGVPAAAGAPFGPGRAARSATACGPQPPLPDAQLPAAHEGRGVQQGQPSTTHRHKTRIGQGVLDSPSEEWHAAFVAIRGRALPHLQDVGRITLVHCSEEHFCSWDGYCRAEDAPPSRKCAGDLLLARAPQVHVRQRAVAHLGDGAEERRGAPRVVGSRLRQGTPGRRPYVGDSLNDLACVCAEELQAPLVRTCDRHGSGRAIRHVQRRWCHDCNNHLPRVSDTVLPEENTLGAIVANAQTPGAKHPVFAHGEGMRLPAPAEPHRPDNVVNRWEELNMAEGGTVRPGLQCRRRVVPLRRPRGLPDVGGGPHRSGQPDALTK
mmetsp:Transcript_54853/g.169865  ORF Transcript_54853/g.169865 Transcript_54853/m.169865 type:complete len:383 (+) Transcript_54853:3-1151(+)